MITYSIAEAKNKLSELIKRALAGEGVVITRHGQPVIELKPIKRVPRAMTAADFEWLRERRERLPMAKVDAGTFVSQMRDEEWER
jgi:prevent-host-death family protein